MRINFNKIPEYAVYRFGVAWKKKNKAAKKKPGYTGYKKHSDDGHKGKNKMAKRMARAQIKSTVRKALVEKFKGTATQPDYRVFK